MTNFAVACLENVMFASYIVSLCGNVLIPEDEKNFRAWYTVKHCLHCFVVFYNQIMVLG